MIDKSLSRIYKILKIVIALFLLFKFLSFNVNASDYHADISSAIYTGENCTTSQSGFCAAFLNQTNPWGRYVIGTTDYGQVNALNFYVNTSVHAKVNGTFRLTATYWANVNYNCVSSILHNCRVVRANNNVLNINWTNDSSSAVTYSQFMITATNGGALNGSSPFKISKVDLYETYLNSGGGTSSGSSSGSSSSNSGDIINNNNQNTQNVINNQDTNTEEIIQNNNSNTQNIIDKITELVGLPCLNLFPMKSPSSNTFSSVSYNDNTIFATANGTWKTLQYRIPVDMNTRYSFWWESSGGDGNAVAYYSLNGADWNSASNFRNTSFVTTGDYIWIRLQNSSLNGSSGTIIFRNLILVKGSNMIPYCIYGSSNSKIDDVANSQNETNNYLKDDSDPTIDNNAIESAIESSKLSNPLSYFLTLPTTLLSAIIDGLSSNSCTDFQIGHFGSIGRHDLSGYTFKFPCINIKQKLGDNLYNTIDLIVAIGIYVYTIVSLYNTVSNYLSLGAENEIKHQSGFLSPMDFLGNLLSPDLSVRASLDNARGGGF